MFTYKGSQLHIVNIIYIFVYVRDSLICKNSVSIVSVTFKCIYHWGSDMCQFNLWLDMHIYIILDIHIYYIVDPEVIDVYKYKEWLCRIGHYV